MLDAPSRPFAEGVVGPVPAVFLEDSDAIAQILLRPRCPGHGAELAAVDAGAVAELELPNGPQRPAQRFGVPALFRIWIRHAVPPFPQHPLVRVGERDVHVDFVDDVRQFQWRKRGEPSRRILAIALHEDGRVGVDLPDGLGGAALERPEVASRKRLGGLHRLIHEVVAVDALAPFEATGDAPPRLDEELGTFAVVAHPRVVRDVASSRGVVEVKHNLHSACRRLREDERVEMVELPLKPAPVGREIDGRVLLLPVAPHLVADQRCAPGLKRVEVVFGHAVRGHHASERLGPFRSAVGASVGLVRDRPQRNGIADAERGEVELDMAGGFLKSQHEARLAAARPVEVAKTDRLLGEVAEAGRGVRIVHFAGIGVLVFKLELQAVVPVQRLRDTGAGSDDLGADGSVIPCGKVKPGCGKAAGLFLADGHIDNQQVALDAGVRPTFPHKRRRGVRSGDAAFRPRLANAAESRIPFGRAETGPHQKRSRHDGNEPFHDYRTTRTKAKGRFVTSQVTGAPSVSVPNTSYIAVQV